MAFMPESVRAVIFDCDGTLVDSEVPGLDAIYELACGLGLDLSRDEVLSQFRGARMAECVAWLAARLPDRSPSFEVEFTQQVRDAMAARFRRGLEPLPGAYELLDRLHIPFCVATNGPREKVELTLSLTGLRPLVGERIFSAYEVGCFKPDPGLFLHAAVALGEAPEHCAVVEDSLPGLQAGLMAGMQVFSLHPENGLPADIVERVIFIRNLTELGDQLRVAMS